MKQIIFVKKKYKASITVFLTLIMLVFLGLTSCLIEVAKTQNMKSYQRIANESAIHSVFGEYSKTLRDRYGLFAIDGSYMSTSYSEQNLLNRFKYYGGSIDNTVVENLQLLSDNNASAMKEQIIYYMENQYGLDYLENLIGDFGTWDEVNLGDLEANENVEQGENQLEELSDVLEQSEEEGADLLDGFSGFDLDLIFTMVSKNIDVSTVSVNLDSLPSGRVLNQGHGTTEQLNYNPIAEKAFVIEYINKFIPNAVLQNVQGGDATIIEPEVSNVESAVDSGELRYQQEYILAAKGSDKDNLKAVTHKLLLLRTPINYAYLMTDNVKKAEVRVLATSLSVASAGTISQEAIYQALL